MTTLDIIPSYDKKTAKFRGTIAAGEKVAVTISDGGIDAENLRLRVVGLCGETLAMFPLPDTNESWGGSDGVLSCELNLDTVQMLKAVPPAATVPLLFVLEDVEAKTLYFKDFCDVTHWPHRRNDTTPVDMALFRGKIEEWERQIDRMCVDVRENADGSVTITVSDGKTGARSTTIRAVKGEKGEQGAHILGGYAYDEADGKYHRIVTYTNEAGEKVPTIDTDEGGAVDNIEDGPIFVKAEGTIVPRSLSERFAVVANVLDFGAWAEGDLYRNVASDGTVTYDNAPTVSRPHHDDTDAIQNAIDYVATQGGGVVFFPVPGNESRYYRLDKQPYEWYDPATDVGTNIESDGLWPLKSQLYIPKNTNIALVGEVPPQSLKAYHIPDSSTFGFRLTTFGCRGVVLRSTVDVEEKVGYLDRPWAVIAAPEGEVQEDTRVSSSSQSFVMENLEVRVHLDCFGNLSGSNPPKLYPTMGAVNLMNVRRMHIENCFFGLDNEIGSVSAGSNYRCLQHSPTTTVGLFGAIEDCAEQKLVHVTVQGFKFGVVLPEMTNANFLHVSNTEYALCFLDCTHASVIDHLSTHNNRRCICALPIPQPTWDGAVTTEFPHPFGSQIVYDEWKANSMFKDQTYKPQVNVRIIMHDYETGHFGKPFVNQMRWGIWDPLDRMYGSVVYHQGFPGDVKSKKLTVLIGDPNKAADVNAKRPISQTTESNGSPDHSFYDHRIGGESASLFKDKEGGVESAIADWMENDWLASDWLQPGAGREYDFNGQNGYVDVSNYFNSPTIPPCPQINGVQYRAPDYGSYYPVLGASHMAKVELKDLASMSEAAKAMAGLDSVLPRELVMGGNGIRKNINNGALRLLGGTSAGSGASLYLYGNEQETGLGKFTLTSGDADSGNRGTLTGNKNDLSWSGNLTAGRFVADSPGTVAGSSFAAAGMPTLGKYFDLGTAGFSISTGSGAPKNIYDSSYSECEYRIYFRKAGWFVFSGTIAAGARIVCAVRGLKSETDNGTTTTTHPVIHYSSVSGIAGTEVGVTVPCPAGSFLQTWITGTAITSRTDLNVCRFIPCVAESVGVVDSITNVISSTIYKTTQSQGGES